MLHVGFLMGRVETLDFLKSFVACNLKLIDTEVYGVYNCVSIRGQVYFYLDQHDLSQRSFIKDQISGERYQDHWSSGISKICRI